MTFCSQLASKRLTELQQLAVLTMPDIIVYDSLSSATVDQYTEATRLIAAELLKPTTTYDLTKATDIAIGIKLIAECVADLAAVMSSKLPAATIAADDPATERARTLLHLWRRLLHGDGTSSLPLARDGFCHLAVPQFTPEPDGALTRFWLRTSRWLGFYEMHEILIVEAYASSDAFIKVDSSPSAGRRRSSRNRTD